MQGSSNKTKRCSFLFCVIFLLYSDSVQQRRCLRKSINETAMGNAWGARGECRDECLPRFKLFKCCRHTDCLADLTVVWSILDTQLAAKRHLDCVWPAFQQVRHSPCNQMRCAATIFVPGCRHLTPQLATSRAGGKAGRAGWPKGIGAGKWDANWPIRGRAID